MSKRRGSDGAPHRRGRGVDPTLRGAQERQARLRLEAAAVGVRVSLFGFGELASQAMNLRLLVDGGCDGVRVEVADQPFRGAPSLFDRRRPVAGELQDLRAVDEAVAREGHGARPRVAPIPESVGPLARPCDCVGVLTAPDHDAIDEPRRERRELSGRHRHHDFVEERQPLLDPLGPEVRLSLEEAGEGDQVGVVEPLADLRGVGRGGADGVPVPPGQVLAAGVQEQVPALDAVAPVFVQEALRARDPARRRTPLADRQQARGDPERRARGGGRVARLEVRMVGALERPEKVVVAPEEDCRHRQPVEVLARERFDLVRRGKRFEGRGEVVARVGFAAPDDVLPPFHGMSLFPARRRTERGEFPRGPPSRSEHRRRRSSGFLVEDSSG